MECYGRRGCGMEGVEAGREWRWSVAPSWTCAIGSCVGFEGRERDLWSNDGRSGRARMRVVAAVRASVSTTTAWTCGGPDSIRFQLAFVRIGSVLTRLLYLSIFSHSVPRPSIVPSTLAASHHFGWVRLHATRASCQHHTHRDTPTDRPRRGTTGTHPRGTQGPTGAQGDGEGLCERGRVRERVREGVRERVRGCEGV